MKITSFAIAIAAIQIESSTYSWNKWILSFQNLVSETNQYAFAILQIVKY